MFNFLNTVHDLFVQEEEHTLDIEQDDIYLKEINLCWPMLTNVYHTFLDVNVYMYNTVLL